MDYGVLHQSIHIHEHPNHNPTADTGFAKVGWIVSLDDSSRFMLINELGTLPERCEDRLPPYRILRSALCGDWPCGSENQQAESEKK